MKYLFFEEFLRLLVEKYDDEPDLFVAFFNQSSTLIGSNYNCSKGQFTHVSDSFKKLLGYDQSNILLNEHFISQIIHPQDKKSVIAFFSTISFATVNSLRKGELNLLQRMKFRARHIKGYWKYFIVFTIACKDSKLKGFNKRCLIADESSNIFQFDSGRRGKTDSSSFLNEVSSNSQEMHADSTLISKRETEILEFISEGLTAKEIAYKLNISLSTVISHRKNIITKFKVQNTASLIRKAASLMLV